VEPSKETIQELTRLYGGPWFNCGAYMEYVGHTFRVNQVDECVEELHAIVEELRKDKRYGLSDKIRDIIFRIQK